MEETPKWFVKPMEKTNISIPHDGINTPNSSLGFDLYSCHRLSPPSHDPLPHDFLDQPIPNPKID